VSPDVVYAVSCYKRNIWVVLIVCRGDLCFATPTSTRSLDIPNIHISTGFSIENIVV